MISAAELAAGQVAYDRVAAFAALRRRRLGLVYALFPLLLVIMGVAAAWDGQRAIGIVCVAVAVAHALFAGWKWRRLRLEDERNRALLARLQAEHGEGLPWLVAERQMAEIRRIQTEESSKV